MAAIKKIMVKTFATEVKIFQTMKELEALDEKVNPGQRPSWAGGSPKGLSYKLQYH